MGEAPWATIQKSPAWTAHARTLGALWKAHERTRLSRFAAGPTGIWTPSARLRPRCFTPSAAPDALYATAFFPTLPPTSWWGSNRWARRRTWPPWRRPRGTRSLKEMEVYITPILQISFFRTNDMEVELAEKGTVPILMTFLAGTGHRILDVRPVAPAADGSLVELGGPGGGRGVCIDFAKGRPHRFKSSIISLRICPTPGSRAHRGSWPSSTAWTAPSRS